MSESPDRTGRGLPPFWWVWVLAGLVLAVAVALFVYRFVVLEPVPVPSATPGGAGPP